MKTMNFSTLLKLAAIAALLGLPVTAGATAPAASVSSAAAGLASADLKVKSQEGVTRVKRVSRLQEPGEAMGGGKERKEAASKKAASGDRE
ncbi:MAG TPA: hypothetical protein DEQ38_13390 [Elusimicrobia bacterium]|nr:MAG: hypothetical protein A2089_05025 [Elusimicrobia bacterium GWD2_63_28]HCC49090.1 hypothetical protein [Elusimicrobiota bacterium]